MEDVNVSNANKHVIVWAVLKTLSPSLSAKVPTWTAYNAVLTSAPVTTTVSMLPIINGSPTLWENLYTAMKEAEKIRKHNYQHGKTIISFDLQLYIKLLCFNRDLISKTVLYLEWESYMLFSVLWKLLESWSMKSIKYSTKQLCLLCQIIWYWSFNINCYLLNAIFFFNLNTDGMDRVDRVSVANFILKLYSSDISYMHASFACFY